MRKSVDSCGGVFSRVGLTLLVALLLTACGGGARSASSQPPAVSAPARAANTPAPATLVCKDCVDAGIAQANVFAGSDLNALACRERWGTPVQILATSTKDGVPIYKVKTPSCTGWVSSRLVQR